MKKIFSLLCLLFCAFCAIGYIILNYKEYTYRELRWVSIDGIVVHINYIWYKDELIFRTWDPNLGIELAVNQYNAIAIRVDDNYSYSTSWYDRYFYIPDKKWFTEGEWNRFIYKKYNKYSYTTQFHRIESILYYKEYRREIESMMDGITPATGSATKNHDNKKAELLALPL